MAVRGWEPWMAAYRHGALFLFPPPPLAGAIDALRWRHDPRSASICDAHVSLSEPLPRALTDDGAAELRDALLGCRAFEAQVGRPTVPEPHPGVVLPVTPLEHVAELRDAVHGTTPFADVPLRRAAVPPHLTIAEFLSLEASRTLAGDLATVVEPATFWCDRVTYARPDESFRFQRVLVFPLGPG